jgi:hypothetical protein
MNLSKLSLTTSILAVPASVVIALQESGLGVIGVLIIAPIVVAILAGLLAIASLMRRDRPRWLSIVALLVAIAPATTIATLVAYKRFDENRYQNGLAESASPQQVVTPPSLPPKR